VNDHKANHREVRLMRELVHELRDERTPALDWEGVERRLGERVSEFARQRQRPHTAEWQRDGLARLFGFAAAAAVVGVLLSAGGGSGPLARPASLPAADVLVTDASGPAIVRPEAGTVYDVEHLGPGTILQSGAGAARFALGGLADWTLAPNSRAVVRSTDVPYVVSLEQGSIRAEVAPQHAAQGLVEAFAVEAGGTRVAVHGTVFSVSREGDGVTVEVTRGSVTVGPAGHRGLTTGHVLVAPAKAQFSLDWGRFARLLPSEALVSSADGQRGAEATRTAQDLGRQSGDATGNDVGGEQGASLPGSRNAIGGGPSSRSAEHGPGGDGAQARGTAPGEQAEEPAAIALELARARMQACLSVPPSINGESTLKLTISSHVTLHLEPDGRVSSVRYSPALNPDLQQRCANTVLGRRIADASGSVGFSVVGSPD